MYRISYTTISGVSFGIGFGISGNVRISKMLKVYIMMGKVSYPVHGQVLYISVLVIFVV